MKTYIITVSDKGARGYNRCISVYRVKNNVPEYIGYDDKVSTASYKGDHAVGCAVISRVDGHKLDAGGYNMASKNIRVLVI